MTYYVGTMPVGEHLSHHGIKGMKWGQRRYQNPDGSLTAAGRVRYGVSNAYSRARDSIRRAGGFRQATKDGRRLGKRAMRGWYKKNEKKIKRAAKIAGATAAVAGTAYLGARYGKSAVRAARGFASKAAPGVKGFAKRAAYNAKSAPMRFGAKAGVKARTAYAKGVVNARHLGQNIKSGFGKAKSTARGFVADSRTRRAARNADKGYERIKRTLNGVPGGSSAFKSAARKAGSAVGGAARKASGAASTAFRGVGYHARRTGAKAKNAARNLGYMAGNVKGNAKRAASKAGTAAKNAAYKAGGKAKTTASRVKNTAKNAPGNAKRVAYNLKNNKAYRYNAIARGIDVAGKAGIGAYYYGHARKRGASKGTAAAIGTTRAVGGMRAGQLAGATYTGYKVAKAYNSPRAKAYRKRQRAKKKSRK